MRILQAASEVFPFCKTGGLADVVGGALSQKLGAGSRLRHALPSQVSGHRIHGPARRHVVPVEHPPRLRQRGDLPCATCSGVRSRSNSSTARLSSSGRASTAWAAGPPGQRRALRRLLPRRARGRQGHGLEARTSSTSMIGRRPWPPLITRPSTPRTPSSPRPPLYSPPQHRLSGRVPGEELPPGRFLAPQL